MTKHLNVLPSNGMPQSLTFQKMFLLWTLCCFSIWGFPQPTRRTLLPVRYPNEEVQPRRQGNGSRAFRGGQMVVFPEDEKLNVLAPTVDMTGNPYCALGSSKTTFCENVTDYPTNEIRRLIRIDKASFQDIFGAPAGIYSRRTINTDDLSEEGVCKHQRQTFFPKLARNDQNFWRYVINDVDYVQAVEAEVCVKEGKECSFVQNSLPAGYQSICRQRFSFKRLLAIDPDEKKSYMDSFRFASCCSCYVKIPQDVFGRSNRQRSTTRLPFNRLAKAP